TGLHRTYPNWLANEAARGNEWHAFANGNPPNHETILPFTRLIGGPMDYTPGIFKLRNYAKDAPERQMNSTLCKQLALYVTLYSPLQMVADIPENYLAYPDAFNFIQQVPVDWDDTQILEAEPGEFITIARKAKGGTNWYIGGITGNNKRIANCHFNFLIPGKKYRVTLFADAPNADWKSNPEAYTIQKKTVTKEAHLQVPIAAGGGFAMIVEELP
ncbi:MAG: glycoside hydrolase family 97 catalytic domain-containing protein, partial [Chitinophagaceae bacterium]